MSCYDTETDVDIELYTDGQNLPSYAHILSTAGDSVFLDCACTPEVPTEGVVGWWRMAPNGEK